MVEIIRVGSLELRFLRSKHDTAGALDMFEMIVPPDARMPIPHYHRYWDETIYGLDGVVTWTVAGKPVAVAPGDSVFIERGVVHGFDNRGTVPAKCLCVLTPGVLGIFARSTRNWPPARRRIPPGCAPSWPATG